MYSCHTAARAALDIHDKRTSNEDISPLHGLRCFDKGVSTLPACAVPGSNGGAALPNLLLQALAHLQGPRGKEPHLLPTCLASPRPASADHDEQCLDDAASLIRIDKQKAATRAITKVPKRSIHLLKSCSQLMEVSAKAVMDHLLCKLHLDLAAGITVEGIQHSLPAGRCMAPVLLPDLCEMLHGYENRSLFLASRRNRRALLCENHQGLQNAQTRGVEINHGSILCVQVLVCG
mmetsp:Transcript_104509/g.248718  ORF Transcript_104509/g.248718 Transcript_104509/m.248718 type:complete len:234 (-) Transcript_104509:890-1591(-)